MQYVLRSPESNPFGDEDAPKAFSDLDVFTKVSDAVEFFQAFANVGRLMVDQSDAAVYPVDHGPARATTREDEGTKRYRANIMGAHRFLCALYAV